MGTRPRTSDYKAIEENLRNNSEKIIAAVKEEIEKYLPEGCTVEKIWTEFPGSIYDPTPEVT